MIRVCMQMFIRHIAVAAAHLFLEETYCLSAQTHKLSGFTASYKSNSRDGRRDSNKQPLRACSWQTRGISGCVSFLEDAGQLTPLIAGVAGRRTEHCRKASRMECMAQALMASDDGRETV